MNQNERKTGYTAESNCDYCIQIPEMIPVKLVWKHPAPGYGTQYCPMCKTVTGMYFCPYIPTFD